jgi:hypothetical protein
MLCFLQFRVWVDGPVRYYSMSRRRLISVNLKWNVSDMSRFYDGCAIECPTLKRCAVPSAHKAVRGSLPCRKTDVSKSFGDGKNAAGFTLVALK